MWATSSKETEDKPHTPTLGLGFRVVGFRVQGSLQCELMFPSPTGIAFRV